ncbi:flagellar hook-basal body protein [Alkalicoccus urumqiensis]|uniref:Flagellar biosynthesis protein FlgG n=1 Tax=Alkalicoccus urumqiensis TaxID=1548213 RepID=A0A2P6MHM3_ALKUR|nr:flagellar hook-basal body protein [Alkalicoccus urumqiensis]PRO65777.1 flagellar biosynthesis protein FlgG [Alkalicoccus urumqiensis]
MNQSMINSAVTMGQIQARLDTAGNNLANANTTGFKRRDTSFSDLLTRQVDNQRVGPYENGRLTPEGIRRGSGAGVSQTAVRFEQGSLQQTGRPLDLAVTQPGYFFEVAPDEEGNRRFTRDGAFYLSPNPVDDTENLLVDAEGSNVLDAAGNPVTLPVTGDITVREDGTITVTEDGVEEEIGQLNLVNITKPQLLENAGNNHFRFPDLDELELEEADVLEAAAGTDVVQQGALEASNVDMGRQMSDLMAAQRHYQFNSSAINMTDQMMGMVTNLR